MSQFIGKMLLISSFVVLSTGLPAVAQELEEITVTAQKREQSLQSVPVAVTAISPKQMELKQITNVHDLQYQIPNISISKNTGTASGARIFLRGIGEDESRVSADPAVGIYVDGIYVGRQVGALFDLVDLERIEVLRGPQGTLYGRNSNGGAIKLVSKKPQYDQHTLDMTLTLGSDNRRDLKATGNLVLTETTAARLTLLTKNRDGFHTLNPNGAFASVAGTEIGEQGMNAIRLGLAHDFSNGWDANMTLDYTNDRSDPTPDSIPLSTDRDNNLFTIEPAADSTCNALTPPIFLGVGCFANYTSDVETKGLSLDISGAVGQYTLNFLTGYRTLDDKLSTRISFPYFQETDQAQFSQEVTLSSNYTGPFNFVAGVYYFTEDVQLDSTFVSNFKLGIETDAWAVFFQNTYDFTDTLTLTTGARYTDETKDLDAANTSTGLARVESRDFQNVTFTASLSQQFTDDIMGYIAYASGFKSGGWSPDCFSADACFQPVDEETLDSFEVGVRSDLFAERLRLNLTYFYNLYDDLQIAATVPGLGFTRFNVNETIIHGLEAELLFRATANLIFNATFGTINAEYDDLTLSQAGGLTNNGVAPACNGTVSIACALALDLKNAPDYKGTVGFVYTLATRVGVLTSGMDVSLEDDSFNLVANPETAVVDVDPLIDARVALAAHDDDWQVAVWGKNLTDEEYARASSGGYQYAADPLTFGVDFGISF